jgi:L-alanine-DL-glutamate epimerase-like enolase superfamily enzyme
VVSKDEENRKNLDPGLERCFIRKQEILKRLSDVPGTIRSVRMYLKNIEAKKRFSNATWTNRQDIIAAVTSDRGVGFAECIASVNCPEIDLEKFASPCKKLIGNPLGKALLILRQHQDSWRAPLIEMMEMALLDLAGKTEGIPANYLLGLDRLWPVSGVHVILSDQPEEVLESTRRAKKNGKTAFIKVKLFGDEKTDLDVIRTVRKQCPSDETFLIGDVNCGYRPHGSDIPEEAALPEIAAHMKVLYEAGLDACEDPADLSVDGWMNLKRQTGALKLIPDEPLRCSRKSIFSIREGMGDVCNIHPDSAGSIIDAVVLAERIRQLGAKIMIGDDSLAGPSASIWQQAASGLHAEWVEATEKETESDFYYRCVRHLATDSSTNPIQIHLQPGFGLDLDEDQLNKECTRSVSF